MKGAGKLDERIAQLLSDLVRHRGKVVGTLLGLILGWMVVEYGLFKTLFVAVCIGLGYVLGSRADREGRW